MQDRHADGAHAVLDALGRPLRDLRISVTDRCNFRCTYCMPREIYGPDFAFLPHAQLLTFEEIARLGRLFAVLGVEKIRLTGGEPLVRRDLELLVGMLSAIDGIDDLALTTNGALLTPEKARRLKEAGLQRVTISLDSLDDEVFRAINGVGFPVARVLAAIEAATAAGLGPVKINMVVKKGVNDKSVLEMARHFRGSGHVLRFIEFMDVGNSNHWRSDEVLGLEEIVHQIDAVWPLEPLEPTRFGEVASRYRYRDGGGEIGIISSITQPFCSSCTRARLSAEGKLYTCLFAADGTDLKGPLRAGLSDAEMAGLLSDLWHRRADRYSELRAALDQHERPKVEMWHIGG